jgi:hypothetical protein
MLAFGICLTDNIDRAWFCRHADKRANAAKPAEQLVFNDKARIPYNQPQAIVGCRSVLRSIDLRPIATEGWGSLVQPIIFFSSFPAKRTSKVKDVG